MRIGGACLDMQVWDLVPSFGSPFAFVVKEMDMDLISHKSFQIEAARKVSTELIHNTPFTMR